MILNELFNHKTCAFLQHIVPRVLQENMKSVDSLSCSVYVYMHFTTQIYSALKYNVFAEWVILILDNFKMNELIGFWQLHLSALCRFPTLCRHIARNWQIRQFDWIVAIFPLAFICMSSCFLFISFKFLDLSKKKKIKAALAEGYPSLLTSQKIKQKWECRVGSLSTTPLCLLNTTSEPQEIGSLKSIFYIAISILCFKWEALNAEFHNYCFHRS